MLNQQLNSIIQVIVNKAIQTVLQTYIVNFSSSQRSKKKKREKRNQSSELNVNVVNINNIDNININR